ncbi:MAG: acetyl-CoA carboxylase biotin carboxylase subunit [Chloroflexi bacterium]|nr:acetyl-CoA carboxylase biotin carboxylase subunit [Chloroflexota bacterium]
MFSTLLIANRGEIAIRVARACRELGIRSVAVYSDPDRGAPHVRAADDAIALGGTTAADSYLRADKLIEIARRVGAEAVHPGYGFLAENADFAEACASAGLIFVGPPPEAMRALGSKTSARQRMQAAGVPVVPGTLEPIPTGAEARRLADEIGYPVALKAVSGGGGKGMRVVDRSEEIEAAFRQASDEAAAAFGDPSMYLERLVLRPRHVEIQILADQHGNAIHLGERECSVQRRHQKLLEESPSPAVTPELRARMGEVAVRAAQAVGYTNAGTCEFLLDRDGNFYFLEVNARLQVEHPVTELVTGIDLVHQQMWIAAGQPLALRQDDIALRGHAVECRIQAEDPEHGFIPSIGHIQAVRRPDGPGVRLDGALEAGQDVTPFYDPMLAKLIVWAEDRPQSLERMHRALGEYLIFGVKTTVPFHRWLMRHPAFVAGDLDTGFLERYWAPPEAMPESQAEQAATFAALAAHLERGRARVTTTTGAEPEADGRWLSVARRAALGMP